MVHGKRMVLKSGMEIGHGRVPGIARFGKETEVGEPKVPYHRRAGREPGRGTDPGLPGMQQ